VARTRNTNLIDVTLDAASFDRAMKRISKYEGRNWRGRVIKAFQEGAKLLVAPMRRAAPRNRGGLARSVSAKLAKRDPGLTVKVNVKPRNPKGAHGHLHSKGHNITNTKGGPVLGWYEGNGFVQRTIEAHEGRVIRFIQTQPLDIDGASIGGFRSGLRDF
jgi:hypothetical protein